MKDSNWEMRPLAYVLGTRTEKLSRPVYFHHQGRKRAAQREKLMRAATKDPPKEGELWGRPGLLTAEQGWESLPVPCFCLEPSLRK